MKFQSKQHEERFLDLVVRDGTYESDRERLALFYIIVGNEDLFKKWGTIYDFEEHMIKLCLEDGQVDFCSSSRALIKLGFNLYNGYQCQGNSPLDLFCSLDEKNMELAMNAIKLRLDSHESLEFTKDDEALAAIEEYEECLER